MPASVRETWAHRALLSDSHVVFAVAVRELKPQGRGCGVIGRTSWRGNQAASRRLQCRRNDAYAETCHGHDRGAQGGKEMLAAQLNARTNVVQPTTPTHSILTSIPSPRSTSESRVEQDALVAVAVASKQEQWRRSHRSLALCSRSSLAGPRWFRKEMRCGTSSKKRWGNRLIPTATAARTLLEAWWLSALKGGAPAEPAAVA